MGKNNQAKRKLKKHKKVAKEKRDVGRRQLRVIGKRPCNGCTVCCSVLGVEPLDKPPWVSCEHLCEEGCGIYETRPGICGEFNCLWQCGLGEMEDRPDKIGVVFAPSNGVVPFTGEEEIQAYEARPGALQGPRAMKISKRLAKGGALVIALPHETLGTFRFMGPKEKVLKAEINAQLAQNRAAEMAKPEEP